MRVRYQRTHKQREIEECTADFLGVVGGYGAGKTHCAASVAIYEAYTYQGSRGLIVGQTYEQVELTVLREIYAELDRRHLRYKPATGSSREILLSNGSIIRIKSLFADAETIKSTEWDWIIIDEPKVPGDRDSYELVVARARAKVGSCRIRVFSNSVPQSHWLAQDYFLRPLPGHKLINLTTYDNRYFLRPGTIERYEARYKPGTAAHARHMLGKVGIPNEGAIFSEFDVSKDTIDEDKCPRIVKRYTAIAPHQTRPTAAVVIGVTQGGPIVILDEFHAEQGTFQDNIRGIRPLAPHGVLCDQDNPLAEHYRGLNVKSARDDAALGDNEIRRLLADGNLKLLRKRNGEIPATHTSMNFEEYVKNTENDASDDPVDANNECIKALRTAILSYKADDPKGLQQLRERMFSRPLPYGIGA